MLQKDNTALVLVDIQGKLATLMHEKEAFFEDLVKMIKGAQVLGLPILWNEQLPDKLGPTIPEIQDTMEGQSPLVKKTFSCCGNDSFSDRLAETGRRQILLTGMEAHICVYQTAIDLLDQAYDVHVVADCVSSRTPANKHIGLEAMHDLGARITSVEMALFEMLQVAEGDQFREIIKIVK